MAERFKKLEELIGQLPAMNAPVESGFYETGFWWVKFYINIHHPLAWNVVQMLAYTINYLSISERLSTVCYPLSPQPVAGALQGNGLYWIIESTAQDFSPGELAQWLESRLPAGNDTEAWMMSMQ